ncbi:MAG: response regulator transcription factor [Chloroflexi bacterium]|nr:response regulator transcription factor [Chloroflexota bacterium]
MTDANTILVIDDEHNLRQTLATILQHNGYQVSTAGTIDDARQYLQAGEYDLVFLDLRLPDGNGTDLLPEIRRYYRDTPVLIITGHATLETAIEAVRQGARDYLIKPVSPTTILMRVKEILEEQQQPARRRKLVSQIQGLLAELHEIDGEGAFPQPVLASVPATDPSRFIRRGRLTVDLHTRHALLEDRYIPLAPTTFDYLVTLVRHSPDPVSYENLLWESQGYSLSKSEAREMARWQVHELRKAFEPDVRNPQYIITVRDVGYRLIM